METTYKQNNTYKQFKNWVKALCMSNEYYFFKTNTYHAIFSAYYIFKHHLKDHEIEEFLDKDFNASRKAWIRSGSVYIDKKHAAMSNDINEISKKLGFDIQIDLNKLNNICGHFYSYKMSDESVERAKKCWKENVMAIYDAWREKELKEIEFKRPSYYAFKQSFIDKYKKLDNLSSAENILWYCIKHNLSIEQAEKYINETVSKRTRPDKMGCYSFIDLKDNFFLKDIFYANNDFFKVCEENRVLRIVNESDIYEKDGMKYYTMSHMDPARRMVTYTYYVTANDKYGHYNFNDLFIGDKKYEAIQKLLEYYEKCPELKFVLYKYCNYSEYTTKVNEFMKISDNQYATKKRQDLIIDRIEPIHMEIKLSSSLFRLEYYNGDFEKMKNDYANILMFIFMIFKCLDYIDYTAYANTVDYVKYCSPIYKALEPQENNAKDIKVSSFKNTIKNIFKKR